MGLLSALHFPLVYMTRGIDTHVAPIHQSVAHGQSFWASCFSPRPSSPGEGSIGGEGGKNETLSVVLFCLCCINSRSTPSPLLGAFLFTGTQKKAAAKGRGRKVSGTPLEMRHFLSLLFLGIQMRRTTGGFPLSFSSPLVVQFN